MAPKYVRGNLFDSDSSLIGVSTNSFLATNNRLVMGRGAALALSRREPEFPFSAGRAIKNTCGHLGNYGWLVVTNERNLRRYGIFQVKYHWRDAADLGLIRYSVDMLNDWAKTHKRPVAINFPGIGNGRRQLDDIFTIVDQLSDWVTIHYFEDVVEARLRELIDIAEMEVPF